jgi:DNA N-6-adenine-methyltransferase (Dam)
MARIARNRSMNNDLMFSSADNEHYTPIDLLFRVVNFYDGNMIDLDPCSNSKITPHTPSIHQFTIEDDGLSQDWFGKVFVNPPYGRSLSDWAAKVVEEYESGRAEEIVFLVPSRTDTRWYKKLTAYPRCNIEGRLKFLNPKNKGNAAPFPSVIFYLGKKNRRFADHFGTLGQVVAEVAPSRRNYMREYQQARRKNLKKNSEEIPSEISEKLPELRNNP